MVFQKGDIHLAPFLFRNILFGKTNQLFTKLFVFYKTVWSKTGFEKYAVIDVQYHGQVVAIKRGENYSMPDTAKAMRQLVKADSKLNRVLNDTMYAAPMKKTNADAGKHTSTKQIVSKAPVKKASRKVVRPTNNKTAGTKNSDVKKPKAVMPRKKG